MDVNLKMRERADKYSKSPESGRGEEEIRVEMRINCEEEIG